MTLSANVFSGDLGPYNLSSNIDDIIFEGRNKSYGAYLLRKDYGKNLLLASLIGIGLSLSVVAWGIYSRILKGYQDIHNPVMNDPTTFMPPPIIPDLIQLPKLEIIHTPKVASAKYIAPQIEEDEKIVKEETLATQDDLKNKNIGSITQSGIENDENLDVLVDNGKDKSVIGDTDPDIPFGIVEVNTSFPGGLEALGKYLSKNIRFPRAALKSNAQGKVFISFFVNKLGKISNVSILKGIGFGCDEEAIRVVQSMPDWSPGKQGGRAVSVKYTLAVSFSLTQD